MCASGSLHAASSRGPLPNHLGGRQNLPSWSLGFLFLGLMCHFSFPTRARNLLLARQRAAAEKDTKAELSVICGRALRGASVFDSRGVESCWCFQAAFCPKLQLWFFFFFFTSAGSAPALSSQVGAYRFPTQHRGRWKKRGGGRRDSCCLSGPGGVGGDIYFPLRPDRHLPGMQVRKPGFREVPHSQVTAPGAPWPLPIKDALWRLAVRAQQGSEAVLRGVSHFPPFPPKLKTFQMRHWEPRRISPCLFSQTPCWGISLKHENQCRGRENCPWEAPSGISPHLTFPKDRGLEGPGGGGSLSPRGRGQAGRGVWTG